ncbi:MAG: RHS repeat-associated core domain-containing protein, partial [Nitrososphaera sp.]
MVTNSSGTVVGEQRYYPFGETRLTTGTIYTDKLFTGQREMAGLGIYHYGARFYSPKLGRFLSPDTIVPGAANPQAWNRFSYVVNNPLKYTDPTGHMFIAEGSNKKGCSDPKYCQNGKPKPQPKPDPKPKPEPKPKDGGGGTVIGPRRPTMIGPSLSPVVEAPPQTVILHPLDSNVVSQVPIFDYSYSPPKPIGYTTTSYGNYN